MHGLHDDDDDNGNSDDVDDNDDDVDDNDDDDDDEDDNDDEVQARLCPCSPGSCGRDSSERRWSLTRLSPFEVGKVNDGDDARW